MNKYRITYIGENGAYVYVDEKDTKSLFEIQETIYARSCVIIGTTLYMKKSLVKIERL